MTDPTNGAAAPPKKRAFGFKKAAWQTAPKTEVQKDMFSHSNEFKDIVAEETRRKNAEKKKADEARKRRLDEERERKRRKVSPEQHGRVRDRGSGSSARGQRMASKGRSRSPMSPTRDGSIIDTLATRYNTLTKSSSSSVDAANMSEVVDLGGTDDEDDFPHNPSYSPRPIPIHTRRSPSEEVEEVDGPYIAALKAQARAKAASKAAERDSTATAAATAAASPQTPKPTAIVQLFIMSEIPNTKPLIVKVKTDTTLAKPKEAWCAKQGFTPEQTRAVFMTWKKRKIYDTTRMERLGINIEDGFVTVEGDPTIYDDTNPPKIAVNAWTEDVFLKRKKEDALEAARAAKAAIVVEEAEPDPEPEPQAKQIRLILKAKGRDDFKIRVNATTEFGHLAVAYKEKMHIPNEQPITLMFDGDRLKPMDAIADADIDDMDAIEVHFK